jgi:hypothetical protein
MTGERDIWSPDELRRLLEKEFLVQIVNWEKEDIDRAGSALRSFESMEMFFEESGWDRDNPELRSEAYLIENRICRWINGRFLYFSRLLWEAGQDR